MSGAWGASGACSLGKGWFTFHPAVRGAGHDPGTGNARVDGGAPDTGNRQASVADH